MSAAPNIQSSPEEDFADNPVLWEKMAAAIRFITLNRLSQPALEEVAARVDLSPSYFQRVFTRHVGLSPKRFLGYLTLDAAKMELGRGAPVLDAAFEAGLSGAGRLHDLFVTYESITPGDFKAGGAGLELTHGFHQTPFGLCLVVTSPRGLVGLAFADETAEDMAAPKPTAQEGADTWGAAAALTDMTKRFPHAQFQENQERTAPIVHRLFDAAAAQSGEPFQLVMQGTNFQVRVWEALLKIPPGATTTYTALATAIGAPKATRAVASAVGRNPISYLIPCHRVVRRDGGLGGYHWGLSTKRALLAWEQAQAAE